MGGSEGELREFRRLRFATEYVAPGTLRLECLESTPPAMGSWDRGTLVISDDRGVLYTPSGDRGLEFESARSAIISATTNFGLGCSRVLDLLLTQPANLPAFSVREPRVSSEPLDLGGVEVLLCHGENEQEGDSMLWIDRESFLIRKSFISAGWNREILENALSRMHAKSRRSVLAAMPPHLRDPEQHEPGRRYELETTYEFPGHEPRDRG